MSDNLIYGATSGSLLAHPDNLALLYKIINDAGIDCDQDESGTKLVAASGTYYRFRNWAESHATQAEDPDYTTPWS